MLQIQIRGLQELAPHFQAIDINKPIIPPPKTTIFRPEFFELQNELEIAIYNLESQGKRDRIEHHIHETLTMKHSFSLKTKYENTKISGCALKPLKQFEKDIKKNEITNKQIDQSYNLSVSIKEILIQSGTEVGLYYGLCTLSQLIFKNQKRWVVQQVKIFDYPTFTLRGITDQQCHGQVGNLESIKRHIRFLARYKNNAM